MEVRRIVGEKSKKRIMIKVVFRKKERCRKVERGDRLKLSERNKGKKIGEERIIKF